MATKKPVSDGGFAKLFGKGADQILVLCRDNDEGDPAIELMISHGNGSTTSVVNSYKSGDYQKRDEIFAQTDEAMARRLTGPIRKSLAALFGA